LAGYQFAKTKETAYLILVRVPTNGVSQNESQLSLDNADNFK